MKIKKMFTEWVTKEIELETPAFFNNSGVKVAVYSEDKIISVQMFDDGWTSVRKNCVKDFTGFLDMIKEPRISEDEFNNALAKAVFIVSGVEICPTLTLQTA